MEMKSSIIFFFFVLSLSLCFCHGQNTPPAPTCPFVDSCNVHFGRFVPIYNISNPDCCKVVNGTSKLEKQCYPYARLFSKIKHQCAFPPPPPPSCPFFEPCDVKFKGIIPTYDVTKPDCCKVVKNTTTLEGECLRFKPLLYKMKFQCSLPPPAPPAKCSFLDACEVKFDALRPKYNIKNPECCKTLKESTKPDAPCVRHSVLFYVIKHQCDFPPPSTPPAAA